MEELKKLVLSLKKEIDELKQQPKPQPQDNVIQEPAQRQPLSVFDALIEVEDPNRGTRSTTTLSEVDAAEREERDKNPPEPMFQRQRKVTIDTPENPSGSTTPQSKKCTVCGKWLPSAFTVAEAKELKIRQKDFCKCG